jgi:CHAD domain-containing protein
VSHLEDLPSLDPADERSRPGFVSVPPEAAHHLDPADHPTPAAPAAFAIARDETPGAGVKRLAAQQLEAAIDRLRGDTVSAHDVHEARKSIKRARALTRLLRPALGGRAYRRESEALATAARHLAGARDADVMVTTLQALLQRDKTVEPDDFPVLRSHLLTARDATATRSLVDAGHAQRTADELDVVRARIPDWLADGADLTAIEPGLRRLYREGRERYGAAERLPTSDRLHEWRKRVKDLRYCTEAVGALDPQRLQDICDTADRLGEMLGDEHDLSVLGAYVQVHRELVGAPGERRHLRTLIAHRRGRLRERALILGAELYAEPPRRFTAPLLASPQ